jgi:hypothetical protein
MSQPHATYEGARKHVGQTFWEVKEGDFDRTQGFDCRMVTSFLSMHSMLDIVGINMDVVDDCLIL